ncbi:hypothetical protein D3C76_1712960 [compost metagenome]
MDIGNHRITVQYLLQADIILYPALTAVVQVHQHWHAAIQHQREAGIGAFACFILLPQRGENPALRFR